MKARTSGENFHGNCRLRELSRKFSEPINAENCPSMQSAIGQNTCERCLVFYVSLLQIFILDFMLETV
jgi:hypothetical protein